MASIRAWVMTLCAACIAAGVLQQLCIRRSGFSVIKLVLTLYILITAFEPIRSFRQEAETFSVPAVSAQAAVPDVKAASIRTAEGTLEKMLASALSQAGISGECVKITLTETDHDLNIENVELSLAPDESAERAENVVQRFMGAAVPVTIRKEDSE